MNKITFLLLLALLSPASQAARKADPAEVGMQFIGTERPSSFPKLILLHIANPAYTNFNLSEAMAASLLIIDGIPSKRVKPFRGAAGIPPSGDWDGCVSLEDFATPITPGKHKVSLKLGKVQSAVLPLKWDATVNWRLGNLKSRKKEIEQLGEVLADGMPRDCVEQWLTVKDGGLQEEDKVRYFLEPGFKVVVPYRQAYEPSGLHAVVDGPAEVYPEALLTD